MHSFFESARLDGRVGRYDVESGLDRQHDLEVTHCRARNCWNWN